MPSNKSKLTFWLLALVCLLAACTSPASQATDTSLPPTTAPITATLPPAAESPTHTPAGETFQNPVLRANFPDPFLLKVDDVYYAYATNGSGKNVQVATSTDLVKWEQKRDAMPGLAPWVQRSRSDVWAPEVLALDGRYILYYTARDAESGKQCVGAAVADEPGGFFKDTSDEPLVCQDEEGGTIDASPFRDGEQLYLLFKNDGNCCGYPTYIYIQELAPDGLSLLGEPERLVRNDRPWEAHVIEAPTMVKREDEYILFYSANDYGGFQYAVGYAVCETVTGPCEDAPENPILASEMDEQPIVVGPGHQTVMEIDGETWMFYHVWEILSSGIRGDRRMMWMDRVEWKDGRPDVIGPTTDPQPVP